MIRFVRNKNGSMTVYVPAKYANRFNQVFEAGVRDIAESEMDDDEVSEWSTNATWEWR